jgi:hypothetical protein
MDYTKKTFIEHLDYMTNEIEKQPNNEYILGRLEMAKDCKKLILSGVVKSFCECKGSGGIRMDGTCGRCTKPLETE